MDGFSEVTDPELLQQLDGGENAPAAQSSPAPAGLRPVEDPDLLSRLEAPDTVAGAAGNAAKRAVLGVAKGADVWAGEAYKQRAEDYDRSFGEIMSDAYAIPEGGPITEDGKVAMSSDLVGSGLSGLYRYGMSRINALGETKESLTAKSKMNFDAALKDRKAAADIPRSESAQRYADEIQKGKSWYQVGWEDPAALAATIGETTVESAPAMAAGIAAGAVTKNPSVAAATMGAVSYGTERYSSVLDFMAENGVDLDDPAEAKRAFFDKDLMAKADQYGVTRGQIVGALDWLSGGLAGTTLAKGVVKNFAAEMATQATLGGAGEALAQGQTKGYSKIDWNDVALEALAEFATAPIEVVGVGRQYLDAKAKPTTEINVEDVLADAAAGKAGARETLVAYGIPEDAIDDMVRNRAGQSTESTPKPVEITDKGADPAQAEAIRGTQGNTPPKENPLEFARRVARERDQRAAQAASGIAPPAAPDATSEVTPSIDPSQQAVPPSAPAGQEPPAAARVESAAPTNANDELTANTPEEPPASSPDANFVPDAPETIAAQHAALADPKNDRKVVMYSADTALKDLPDKPKGRHIVRRTFKVNGVPTILDFNTAKTNYGEVQKAIRTNTLNELLSLGPVNKEQAAQSAVAGNPPVGVVERTPEGTEVKAAVGTTETAPAQVQALEATKAAPANTVVVEPPAKVVADRQAASGVRNIDPDTLSNEERERLGLKPATGRVLEDISPEGQAKKAQAVLAAAEIAKKRTAAEEAKRVSAERAAKKEAKSEEVSEKLDTGAFENIEDEADARASTGGAKWSPEERAAIRRASRITKDTFDQAIPHIPEMVDTSNMGRMKDFLGQAVALAKNGLSTALQEAKGSNKKKAVTDKEKRILSVRAKSDYPTVTDHVVWVSEANRLLRRVNNPPDSETKMRELLSDLNQFLANSEMLKEGDGSGLRASRQESNKALEQTESSDSDRKELAGPADLEFGESVREEEDTAGRTYAEDTTDALSTSLDETDANTGLSSRVRRDEPVEEGVDYTVGKAAKAPITETRKKRVIRRRESVQGNEAVAELDEADVLQEVTFAQALEEAGEVKGNGVNRSIVNRLLTRLNKKVGDTPIKIVAQETLDAMYPDRPAGRVDGYYDPQKDHIVLSANFLKGGQFDAQILAHEGVHAYLQQALDSDAALRKDIQEVLDFAKSKSGKPDAYGFSDVHEFLAEALSNYEFQNMLMKIKVTPQMAAKFDMPMNEGNSSLWGVLVKSIREHLGLGRKEVDALSYVLRLADRAEIRTSKTPDANLMRGLRRLNMLSEGRQKDYKAQFTAAGVPKDTATELNDFIVAELGKSIDPGTLPLFMADMIRQYGKATAQSNNAPPPPPIINGAPPPSSSAGLYGKITMGKLRRFAIKVATLDYLRQTYNSAFNGLLDVYVKAIQKYEAVVSDVSERHDKDAADFLDLLRTDPVEGRAMADLAMEATALNVRLGPNADNSHLGKEGKRAHQGRTRLDDLNTSFMKLKPATRALYKRMTENYRETHNNNVRALAYNLLTDLDLDNRLSNSDLIMLLDKVVAGTLTENDAKIIGEPKIYTELKRATTLRTIKGDYFPQMRFGDFVVMSTDKIPDPKITHVMTKGGKRIPIKSKVDGDTVSFQLDSTLRGGQAALNRFVMDYIEKSDLTLINATKTHVDRQTGKVTPEGEMEFDRDYDLIWNLEFQTRGVNFFESEVDANKFRAELIQSNQGMLDGEPTPVLDRRVNGDQFEHLVSASALTQVTKRINDRTDIPEWRRKQMNAAVREAIISQMTGNRAQKRHMARRNVKGASNDLGRAAVTYGQAAGNYYATLSTAKEVRDAFQGLEKHEGTNQFNEGADVRSQVMNELRARQQTMTDPMYSNKVMQHIATLSFLDKLFSPSHSMVNFMQVIGNTLPYLGGKYGNAKSSAAVLAAYNKMGVKDVLVGGAKNTASAVKDWQRSWLDTSDLVGSVRKKLGKDYEPLIDELVARGILEPNSGFEIGAAVSGGAGKFGTTLSKLDRAARQLPAAVEVVNRMVSAVATYDLATSQGKSPTDAIQEAYDTISMTQGDYRRSNNPRFMRDPKLAFAMQFKKYAVMQTQLIGDMYTRALNGATPEERNIARKQLANTMGMQVMLAGAMGLPGLELIKLALMLSSLLGGPGWDDQEEKLKQILDESMGEKWSELIRKGVVSRIIGVDISQRMSQADLWTGFTPDKLDKDTIPQYIGSLVLGAPGATVVDWGLGLKALGEGDVQKFAEKVIPIKTVSDALTAYRSVQDGKMTPAEGIVKTIGFAPARIANINEEKGAEIRANTAVSEERKALYRDYINASTPAQRARMTAKIRDFNARQGKNGRKLNPKSLEKKRLKELERYQVTK